MQRTSAVSAPRDTALDIVKGICVVIMVIHHAINYFPTEAIALKYFRFVSGAFLFMAGFVSTHIYFAKYDLRIQKVYVARRLIIRGVKLLLIFLVANIVINSALAGKSGGAISRMALLWSTPPPIRRSFRWVSFTARSTAHRRRRSTTGRSSPK